jgi:hypothetical protein
VRSAFLFLLLAGTLAANDAVDRAHKLEDAGNSAAARDAYTRARRTPPKDPQKNNP